jgi:hypothetical protein
MLDVELRRMMMDDRIATLRRDATRPIGARPEAAADVDDVELRLCKSADDPALERLSALAERPIPAGRLVLALVGGRIVAALPLSGGEPISDPFTRTSHLVRLLELRASQLRQRDPRPALGPRLLRRHA